MHYYDSEMSYYDRVYERIWDTNFWLPKNITWEELQVYTKFDFNYLVSTSIMLAFVIYAIRLVFEKYVATPIGRFLKVPDSEELIPNLKLEAYFKDNQVMSESIIMVIWVVLVTWLLRKIN